MNFFSKSKEGKNTAVSLSSHVISPELKLIRDQAQMITLDAVRNNDGYKATELQLALGYLVFFEWLMSVLDEEAGGDLLTQASSSIRMQAFQSLERVRRSPSVVTEIQRVVRDYDPELELELGLAKSRDSRWMRSTTRGVIVSARMMAFSFCKKHSVETLLPPISPGFGEALAALPPQEQIQALKEWLVAVLGQQAELILA